MPIGQGTCLGRVSEVTLVEPKKHDESVPIVHRVASESLDVATDAPRCHKLLEVLKEYLCSIRSRGVGFVLSSQVSMTCSVWRTGNEER